METCITRLQIGQEFQYKGMFWKVTDRTDYPFIEAKCLTEPNEYQGINVLFTNFEKVTVPDEDKIYKERFVETRKGYYQLKVEL